MCGTWSRRKNELIHVQNMQYCNGQFVEIEGIQDLFPLLA